MDYQVKQNAVGNTHVTMKPPSMPKMSEYDLTNVRIKRVSNGCTVECNYKMKPETEAKMRGKNGKEYLDYDLRNPTEEHVFNNIGEAAEFIEARLLGKDYEKKEKQSGDKVKVRKVG